MTLPTMKDIRARWAWDSLKPTTVQIRTAVRLTGNDFGITVMGVPYLEPFVGMKVETATCGDGVISQVRAAMSTRGDPEVQITTDAGRIVYLHQTALNGYRWKE